MQVQVLTDLRVVIHHARFGEALKCKMDPLGIRCEVDAGDHILGGGERVSLVEFLQQKFAKVK